MYVVVSLENRYITGNVYKFHSQIDDEQEQPETAQNTSPDEHAKPDLEADNKQLRELVTSFHQKQQTTSLEVLNISIFKILNV